MLNVALTGNIAAGKSSVVELFRRWGATVIDADALARDAQAPGSAVLAAIAKRFGADVLAADGSLDRVALRGKVMGDNDALLALNAIVHPAVQQRRLELQRAAAERGDAIVVNDIPLLFEVLDPAQFDTVVLVDAPVAIRRTRLRALRGSLITDFGLLEIENGGTLPELEASARAVFDTLRQQAARAGLEQGLPGQRQALLLCAADAKDGAAVLQAIQQRYTDAGVDVQHATPRTLPKMLRAATPDALVATAVTTDAVRKAWEEAVRPCRLYLLSPDPDPVAVRLDLRPWGHDRIALSEEDGAGLAPRSDLL